MNRYELIANELENQIRSKQLHFGEKLPSIRTLSASQGVSPGTIVEALELLRARGMIESRDRSGFFVSSRAQSLTPHSSRKRPVFISNPAPADPDDLIFELRQAAHDMKILPFGAASPTPEFFPINAVKRASAQALRDEPGLISEYRFPPGSLGLRAEIARIYRRHGVNLDAEWGVTTSGAIEAIALSLRVVTRPEDWVAVETPTYFGILQLVRSLGLRIVEIPLDPERGLDPTRFDQATSSSQKPVKAAILVPNYSNPMGTLTSIEDKKALVEIASGRGVVIIEDDIYGDLGHSGMRPPPFKAFDRDDSVILCGSFAKTIAPGFRAGFLFSERYAKEITMLRTAIVSGTSSVMEETLAHYLKSGNYERHLGQVRASYRTLVSHMTAAVADSFPAGTRITQPKGGYLLWVQLPGGIDSRVIQRTALARGISVASGVLFSTSGDYADCMRINCALPWIPRVQRGIGRLAEIASDLMRQSEA